MAAVTTDQITISHPIVGTSPAQGDRLSSVPDRAYVPLLMKTRPGGAHDARDQVESARRPAEVTIGSQSISLSP